jgi:hypothetical protein
MGHSSFVAWSGKHCSGCFCLLDTAISCLGFLDTVWWLLDNVILECVCLQDTARCSKDQGRKLRCPVDKNIPNSVCQTKPRTSSVPQTNFPISLSALLVFVLSIIRRCPAVWESPLYPPLYRGPRLGAATCGKSKCAWSYWTYVFKCVVYIHAWY